MSLMTYGKRGGLVVDRDSLHASPEYRRQIDALNTMKVNPMTLPQVVQERLQALSDRKLNTWQGMAVEWPAGRTQPINADAFLSLIVEVKRQRAELHRLTEIAEGVEPLVIRLGEVTGKLQTANVLLRECYEWLFESLSDGPRVSEGAIEKHYYTPALEAFHERIQSHLQGAGLPPPPSTPEKAE